MAQTGESPAVQFADPVGTQKPSHPDEKSCGGATEDVGSFLGGVASVDRNDDRPA